MDDEACARCDALAVRIDALARLMDEREDRTKERFVTLDRSITNALNASEKAVAKAELATEKRFEGVNEFRETLRDQALTLLPRNEYDAQHRSLRDLVGTINERVSKIENTSAGKTEGLSLVGQIVLGIMVAVSSVAAVLIAVFKH